MESKINDKWVPTPNQRKFAEEIVRLGEDKPLAAFKLAYPNQTGKYMSQSAWKLLRNPNIRELIEEIQQTCRSQFVTLAPEAIDRLIDLAKNAASEKVRLQANIEILDRAGLKPPDKVELSHIGVFGDLSPDKIKDMIKRNLEDVNSNGVPS